MFQKFSVKKPFTVLVGVVLIIVLGVVSFMNTSTDLMPSMNLPIAVVMTTYVGATPEQVEGEVTAPIETRMGSVSGIDTIRSISNEHFSLVILQFTGSTNMDTASLDIREALDMTMLPDGAGKPMVLKLNPDMMPVMVASVYMEGLEQDELSELTENELVPILEGVPGVSAVTPMGLIRNQLHVALSSEKVEAVSERIGEAVQAMVDAAMEEAMSQTQAIAEAMISEQVAAYSEERMAELIASGMSPIDANSALQMELPAVIEQISHTIQEELAAQMAESAPDDLTQGMGNSLTIPEGMLTVDAISGMLHAQNFSMPAGMMTDDGSEYMIRVGDKFTDISEIADMLIFDPAAMGLEGMAPVRLSDVADVFATDNSDTQYARVNGHPTVMLMMQKQTEFATSDLASDLRNRMESLEEEYPGLGFVYLMDQGEEIGTVISAVLDNLLYGALLAIIILILFLWDLRPTLVVAVSIPVSLMLAFAAMYFTGVSLNIISMSGLALAVGMLVDNSIVVIENIYRLRSQGKSAAQAAIQGAGEVAGAIAASTLTTIAVFFPIVFTQGLTRQIFTDLALTIAFSLLASLLIALTVVPAASSAVFGGVKEKETKRFNRFRDSYANLLRPALRYKWAVLLFAVVALVLSFWGISRQGMELIPSMDSPQLMATVQMPEDATFEDAVSTADLLSGQISGMQGVDTVGAVIGGGMMGLDIGMFGGGSGGTSISMYVLLSENRDISSEEVSRTIRERAEAIGCEVSIMGGSSDSMSMLSGDPISVSVQGRELDAIRDTAIEVAEIIKSVPGAINVTGMDERGAPELRIRVDKDKAMAQGLTVAQVFMATRGTLTAPETSSSVTLGGKNYELVISDGDWQEPDRAALEALVIPNPSGELVNLSDIAEIYEDTGFTSINRLNKNRRVTVSGEIDEGYNVSFINAEIERLLEGYTPKDGCSVSIGGEALAISEAFGDLYLMLLLALVFIYLIMVAQFQSLRSPFIVMFTIPLAFTGGFLGLLVAGMPLSIVSMVGLILLTGVVVNNGIVFISCVNQLRQEGMAKKDALVEAGRIRLRPILMTALTTIVAMSVMALGMGQGTEMVQPMAIATIGGLLYATLMTLFVVPALYDLFFRK